jgi:diguanylate cyclase (GGDEF)-like protein/PAS domain S-box-containing protein
MADSRVCSIGQRYAARGPYTGVMDTKTAARPSIAARRILLIGHGPSDGRSVRAALADDTRDGSFIVECAPRLVDGLERLRGNGIAAVLLDLRLPDSEGIAAFEEIRRTSPYVPVLVIGSPADEDVAKQALERGAQDHLHRHRLDKDTLPRALKRVIERHAADEALFFEQQRANVTLNSIGDAVLSTDRSGTVTYLNPVAERMTGWPHQEALGRPLADIFQIIDGTTREPARNPMDQAMQLDGIVGLTPNCLLIRRDGVETAIEDSASPIHDRAEHVIGAVIVFHDVSAARALSLQAIHLSQHDFLTDLPNRMLLNDRLTQAIGLARRHGHHLAVLFLDLDRFKHVNDSLGHGMGDMLLQSVARRLVTCVRSSDTVSRQGGDEFVVLLSEIEHADDAAATAQKIIAALVAPHDVAHHQLHVTVTIGISIYPADGPDAETLIKCADTAMYHAKDRGRNTFQFFEREMNARAVERQWIEAGLHRALARREFTLHYQPKIDLETGATTGAEALIRWVHPKRGLLFPKDFVPIAEDCGLIVPIGQWVLREACRQARAWIDEGRRPMAVAVNISAVEFRDPRFLENVRTVLRDSRLDPRYLELELTESSLLQHADSTALALQALKDMGVQVAIDDFGTGYSSLSYLRQFPTSVLKIDQSFVHEISADPVGTSIVCAVISMGRSLGHRVIAEGVETEEQLAFLQAQYCGEGQGYYFSRPLAAEQFARLPAIGRPGLVLQ